MQDLAEIERFARTVVLHDEISMEAEPFPYDLEFDSELTEEEEQAGGRNVIVAMGPILTGYDFFTEKHYGRKPKGPDITLSPTLIEVAREFSNADEGNVYYDAHVEYLQRIVSVIRDDGSALLSGEFGSAAIDASAEYPAKIFQDLDRDWQDFAKDAYAGKLGFMVPPVLSIILTRCAKRDAIPAILKDLRDEWADARAKVWALLSQLRVAPTIAEALKIRQELATASRQMSPASKEAGTMPIRVLWELFINGTAGGVAMKISGGPPVVGAAISALSAAAKYVPQLIESARPAPFRHGAFDLARRVRREAANSEYGALVKILTDSEKCELGF